MQEELKLTIERDIRGRIVNRITENYGEYSTVSYSYNINDAISDIVFMENNVVTIRQEYRYEYDPPGHKTLKVIEMTDFVRGIKTKSVFIYKNEYYENKITKKACLFDGVKLYENMYYYEGDKLIRIERYNGGDTHTLWRVELLDYSEHMIESTVYLPNNIVSHTVIYRILEGEVVSQTKTNPSKGRYYWTLSSFGDDYCSVYVGESDFSGDVLSEILSYVSRIRKAGTGSFLVVIECSDTNVDPSEHQMQEVENYYREHGLNTQYSP